MKHDMHINFTTIVSFNSNYITISNYHLKFEVFNIKCSSTVYLLTVYGSLEQEAQGPRYICHVLCLH